MPRRFSEFFKCDNCGQKIRRIVLSDGTQVAVNTTGYDGATCEIKNGEPVYEGRIVFVLHRCEYGKELDMGLMVEQQKTLDDEVKKIIASDPGISDVEVARKLKESLPFKVKPMAVYWSRVRIGDYKRDPKPRKRRLKKEQDVVPSLGERSELQLMIEIEELAQELSPQGLSFVISHLERMQSDE